MSESLNQSALLGSLAFKLAIERPSLDNSKIFIIILLIYFRKQSALSIMGVNKLWDLLLTVAVGKKVEDLSGLILAIDASLWIVKVNSIYENQDEGLKCIFNKLLWLKRHNILPIFVFDGDTPSLKRRTLQQRRKRRKQISDLDISKKVEIEIVKKVTGKNSREIEKSEVAKNYNQKSKQIDIMLETLLKYQNSVNPIQISEKIALQHQILNKRYQLQCELYSLGPRYGSFEQFIALEIEDKQQILERVAFKEGAQKDLRAMKQSLTEQEKILFQMEIIKKKSRIRQLQDNLYRKVMTKRVQNGYEVIQGIYNGKKVVQKRKIKNKAFDEWGFKKGKRQTCNNFEEIFARKQPAEQNSQNEDSRLLSEEGVDFFSNIFNKDYSQDKRETTFQDLSQRLSEGSTQSREKGSYITENIQLNDEDYYSNLFNEVGESKPSIKQKNVQNDDPDNFPDYLAVEKLDQLCTSKQNIQLQNMLDILGINYIVAPFQAEAQCAALEQMQLVDGIVTEDSDVFLFGGRKVFRGLFQDNIKLYSMKKVESSLYLTRQKLILFALMLGSDYTQGIKGIGMVNAMQILKVHHDIDSLEKFTNWARNADIVHQQQQNKTDYMLQNAMSDDQIQFYRLHRKYKNYWHVKKEFPENNIYNAYLDPQVQTGQSLEQKIKEKKKQQESALEIMMSQRFKMSALQIQSNMKLLKKQFNRAKQTVLTDYIQSGKFAKIVSKRLQKAVDLN